VEYSLTDLGMSLRPVVDAMCRWGEAYGGEKAAREA
jgi:DNA-binding HxlR family transcriptional regulator